MGKNDMRAIKDFPMEELVTDRQDCIDDLAIAQFAKARCITLYHGKSVQDRIYGNNEMLNIIEEELTRRLGHLPERPKARSSVFNSSPTTKGIFEHWLNTGKMLRA